MSEPLLRVENLHKAFEREEVLRGINLEVRPHEVVFVIGPSGAGKSTFLRCINRLEEPTRGRVTVAGREVTARDADINDIRKEIGFVFQTFNLYPNYTALGNVSLALRKALGMSRSDADARARKALTDVGLDHKVDAYPAHLSGGQQQRVGIARALALDPKLILFDEPTSSLDPELVGGVLDVMRRLAEEGVTMVVVSHEMSFARDAAHRVLMMDAGLIVEEGPPSQMFQNPTERRTQEFLERILSH